MRLYKFAKEMDKDSGDLIHELRTIFNIDIKSHLSSISEEQMKEVKDYYNKENEKESHHEEAMGEVFNVSEDLTIDDKLSLGIFSGDDIVPPSSKIDEKAIKELKKENEKEVQNSIKSAEESREKYATTVSNIVENPDNWHIGGESPKIKVKNQEVILEKPPWWSRLFSWWSGS